MDALCKRYRVDNSKRVQHTALVDCDLLSKVYVNLTDQKEPTLNFQNLDIDTGLDKIENIDYYKKIVVPSAEEKEKHNQFLRTFLKKNFFN